MNIIDNTNINDLKNNVNNNIDNILKTPFHHKIVYEPHILNEEEMNYLEKFIRNKLVEIRNVIDTLPISDVRDICNYVNVLQTIINRAQNPCKCDIVSLYTKYSHIIHLLVSFYNEQLLAINDQDMFEDDLNFDNNVIFTKCFSSVSTLKFLLGGNNNIAPTHIRPKELKDLIISLKTVPSYYLEIAVGALMESYQHNKIPWESNFNHVFAIIKYRDTYDNDYYYVAQSYFYKYCPRTIKYTLDDMLQLIDDVTSIYYDSKGNPIYGSWTGKDNDIWRKYFLADESEYIGKIMRDDKYIKMHAKSGKHKEYCFCFQYVYNVINTNNCYNNILVLLEYCEANVNNCFDNICRNFLSLFTDNSGYIYDRPFFIDAVKTGKFIQFIDETTIIDENNINYGTLHISDEMAIKYKLQKNDNLILLPLMNPDTNETLWRIEEIPETYFTVSASDKGINKNNITKSWHTFKADLTKTKSKFILDKFDVNSYQQCLLFLDILVQFYDLKHDVMAKPKFLGSKSYFTIEDQKEVRSKVSYRERYIQNKVNYSYLSSLM